jgi:hypothetical protein
VIGATPGHVDLELFTVAEVGVLVAVGEKRPWNSDLELGGPPLVGSAATIDARPATVFANRRREKEDFRDALARKARNSNRLEVAGSQATVGEDPRFSCFCLVAAEPRCRIGVGGRKRAAAHRQGSQKSAPRQAHRPELIDRQRCYLPPCLE